LRVQRDGSSWNDGLSHFFGKVDEKGKTKCIRYVQSLTESESLQVLFCQRKSEEKEDSTSHLALGTR